MANRGGSFHQTAVIPATLFCMLAIYYPITHHHSVITQSPLFATKAEVERWKAATATAEHCEPQWTEYEVASQSYSYASDNSGPWFGTLKCNKRNTYWYLGTALALIYSVLSTLARLLFPAEKPRKD